jgi:hypothetical protein
LLKPLPVATIGDIARHGLELHVYCACCHATRRISIGTDERLQARNFATALFRCTWCPRER